MRPTRLNDMLGLSKGHVTYSPSNLEGDLYNSFVPKYSLWHCRSNPNPNCPFPGQAIEKLPNDAPNNRATVSASLHFNEIPSFLWIEIILNQQLMTSSALGTSHNPCWSYWEGQQAIMGLFIFFGRSEESSNMVTTQQPLGDHPARGLGVQPVHRWPLNGSRATLPSHGKSGEGLGDTFHYRIISKWFTHSSVSWLLLIFTELILVPK